MYKRKRHFTIAGRIASADQWASIMMLVALGLALFFVNSPLKLSYDLFHHTSVAISFGDFVLQKPLVFWINEGLMAFFFLAVTLEIKRELLEGHLSCARQMLLPVFAALGGMVVPAAFYLFFNRNNPELMQGWAIPTATDIALSLGVLSLLGKRVPVELKLFLAALAIFDDLGGIVIIALFYGSHLTMSVLVLSLFGIATLFCLNRFGVTHASLYIVIGIFLWATFQESGIHPTMAGVAVALALPLRLKNSHNYIPLKFVEDGLHLWVAFFIVPLFAFFNAGIILTDVSPQHISSTLSFGIILGLVIGKPIGIFSFAWLAHALGLASLTNHVNWRHIFGVALLGGIGFTMALFLNTLAFPYDDNFENGQIAILIGSSVSAVLGWIWLHLSLPQKDKIQSEA
ncbi:MAG: Na+/H+ antiporter NhaA [Micavibrio sp.]|nr:Na+/H+ antiporter NhaA [Micavibrio sp.]